jgi:hypothetical protein
MEIINAASKLINLNASIYGNGTDEQDPCNIDSYNVLHNKII